MANLIQWLMGWMVATIIPAIVLEIFTDRVDDFPFSRITQRLTVKVIGWHFA